MAEYIDRVKLLDELGESASHHAESGREYQLLLRDRNIVREQPITNVIPIPEGATNGDVIKAMFPQWDLREEIGYEYKLFGETHKFEGLVDEDWWNAPYKKEVEE